LKLDDQSKDVLKFRPNINFVEPDQEEVPIEVRPDLPDFDEVKNRRKKIKAYANSLNLLAEIIQGMIDDEAEAVIIELDPNIDIAAIQAMRRAYPDADPNRVTYEQFKQCEENLRNHAESIASNSIIDQNDVASAREDILRNRNVPIGGLGTREAENGGLRPELDKRNQIVEPINLDDFQNEMLKVLVNTIWKKFMLPLFKPLPIVGSAMPDELVSTSKSTENMMSNIKDKGAETL
jgi:hypothetical protein